jgi:hypothetical protein
MGTGEMGVNLMQATSEGAPRRCQADPTSDQEVRFVRWYILLL